MLFPQRLTVEDPGTPLYKEMSFYAATACVGMVVWLWKWAFGKLDGKADRAELKVLLEDLRIRDDEARESRKVIHEKLDDAIADANRTAVAVARLEGSIGRARRGD